MKSASALDLTETKRGTNFKVSSSLVRKVLPLDHDEDFATFGIDQAFLFDGKVSVWTNSGKSFQLSCSQYVIIDSE